MNPSDRDLVSGLKTDSYSGPFSQNQIAPVPLPTSSKSSDDSLETLIEYYSAKNKLTAQEKAVVRTIISQRMNAGQPPKLLTESERNSVNAVSFTLTRTSLLVCFLSCLCFLTQAND